MANSSTALTPIKINIGNNARQIVKPYIVNYDTPTEDLTIATPSSTTASVGIVGIDLVSSTAFNLTVKSGATSRAILQFAANSGWSMSISDKIKLPTSVNEALKFNSDAALPLFTVYILEFEALSFSTRGQ